MGQYAIDCSKEGSSNKNIMQRSSVWRASRGRALQDQSSDSVTQISRQAIMPATGSRPTANDRRHTAVSALRSYDALLGAPA